MNLKFREFIETCRSLAIREGLDWELPVTPDGEIPKADAWNLTLMAGASPPPSIWFRNLGPDLVTLKGLNEERERLGRTSLVASPLSPHWQDLLKAAIIDRIYIARNQPASVMGGVVRPLRALATCSTRDEPWMLTREDLELAQKIAATVQKSGKLCDDIGGAVRLIVDGNLLADRSPIAPAKKLRKRRNERETQFVRQSLDQRKSATKLPEERAFWEAVRIAWTEQPTSFLDFQKFSLLKVLILCGFRGNEAARIPLDWQRWREYTDLNGRPAGEKGGVSRSLMLRHFAEKQRTVGVDGIALYETVQHIPEMFQSAVISVLTEVGQKTSPLRDRLSRQIVTGRIFPELDPNQLVPVTEFYTRLTGNPFIYEDENSAELIARYKSSLDISVLKEIRSRQAVLQIEGAPLLNQVRIYLGHKLGSIVGQRAPFRDSDGDRRDDQDAQRVKYKEDQFLVGELEDFLRETMPTKLSDDATMRLSDGRHLQASDFLFLAPKRPLAEERNNGVCDITQYAFVGRLTHQDLVSSLCTGSDLPTLFEKYSDEGAKHFKITAHMFRHLQNTELFRLGVADTIITKRFMKRAASESGDRKMLNENLAPLRRYFSRQVGRPWGKIWSEVCENLRVTSTVQQHVRDHISDFVAYEGVSRRDGQVYVLWRWGGPRPLEESLFEFWVDPATGILLCNKRRQTHRMKRKASQKEHIAKLRKRMIERDDQRQFHLLDDGAWWEVSLEKAPSDLPFADVVLSAGLSNLPPGRLYGRSGVYATGKRQLTDYRLRFNLEGRPKNKAAPANIEPYLGEEVWGVLYKITRRNLVWLDSTEGVPGRRYRQIWLDAEDADGCSIAAAVYIAQGKETDGNPSLRYITLLREGARVHGLPAHWQEKLNKIQPAR